MRKTRSLVVIMPAYNEEGTIYSVLKRVLRQRAVRKVVVVDDGSTDETLRQARRAAAGAPDMVSIIACGRNMGKGHAIRTALSRIDDDDLVIIQDADDEYYPEDYAVMLKAFDGNPVFGYRKRNRGNQYLLALFMNILHTWLFNVLYGQSVKDVNVCYKLFRKSMLKGRRLTQNGFAVEEEIAVLLSKNSYKILNVPIRYKGRRFGEGKKIGPRAAIGDMVFLLRSRF